MYFEGDPLIWKCPIVGAIPSKEAVECLIAPLDMNNTIPMIAGLQIRYRTARTPQTLFETVWRGCDAGTETSEGNAQPDGRALRSHCCVPTCDIEGVYPNDLGDSMVNDKTKGERITVTGTVYDGTGTPLKDAMVEIWQADAQGFYPGNDPRGQADPNFTGWGRKAGDYDTGEWVFETVKPGAVPSKMAA